MVKGNNLSSKNNVTLESKKVIDRRITPAQNDFLDFCEKFGWGKVEETIVRGEPVASKELEKTHRHDT